MIKTLSLAVLLASSVSAGTPLQNAALLAAEIGAPTPASFEAPRAPVARETEFVRVPAWAAASGPVSGTAWLTGNGFMNCSASGNGMGWMSGWVNMRGDARVSTTSGATGSVPAQGTVFVSGSCSNGSGYVSGSGYISGTGTLYKDGRPVGSASLGGNLFLHQYASGNYLWANQYVLLNGRYDEKCADWRCTVEEDPLP